MAQFEDAANGWEIYRNRSGSIGRTQLNVSLRARGYEAVSERTYRHYQKLMRLGYSEYVPINRLDVRHANDSPYNISDSTRYLEQPIRNSARLLIPKRRSLVELQGTVDRVSEGFAVLLVPWSEEASESARANKYNRGVLIFEDAQIERAVRIVEALSQGSDLQLVLEFRSLLEMDLLQEDSPFPQSGSQLTIDLGADASLFTVLTAMHTTFDLLESMRGFVQFAVATGSSPESSPPTPPFRIRQIEFSNPLELVVAGAVVVIGGVAYIIKKVAAATGEAADAASKIQNIHHESAAERRRSELHEVQIKSLQLDNVKKAIEVVDLLNTVRPEVDQVMGIDIPQLTDETQSHLEGLKNQAVEAAVELQLMSGEPVQLEESEPEHPTAT